MEPIRKINDELAIAGQIHLAQFPQVAAEGYRAVLNLRSPEEAGFLTLEAEKLQLLGLCYLNLPTPVTALNPETVLKVLDHLRRLPKPTLLHCDSGIRSAAIALISISVQQGVAIEQALRQAERLGLLQAL
ncbi:MAG: sulfur transferase domain-containing protein [Oculatellaceae cyanobacterium Prado106]|jgi:uncharacterized protein (TIGR01244 family)|nr:sulfur transferase domain-containing protein [Oculatellaceae cyanobacterium Prado106]